MSRRPAPDRDESGFTLVEVIVYVVLIGIIIVPLATVTTQAIRFFPTSNARSQTAANLDRLQYQFADDVAEAQLMINFALNQTASATNVWWPGIARHTSVVSGPITCASPAPALNSSTTTKIFESVHNDLGITGSAVSDFWQITFTNNGSSNLLMQLQRYDVTGSTTGPTDTYLTAYCSSGASIGRVDTYEPQPNAPESGYVDLVLQNLSDNSGNAIDTINVQSAIRTSYS